MHQAIMKNLTESPPWRSAPVWLKRQQSYASDLAPCIHIAGWVENPAANCTPVADFPLPPSAPTRFRSRPLSRQTARQSRLCPKRDDTGSVGTSGGYRHSRADLVAPVPCVILVALSSFASATMLKSQKGNGSMCLKDDDDPTGVRKDCVTHSALSRINILS